MGSPRAIRLTVQIPLYPRLSLCPPQDSGGYTRSRANQASLEVVNKGLTTQHVE